MANWQIATKLFWVFCVQVPEIVLNNSVLSSKHFTAKLRALANWQIATKLFWMFCAPSGKLANCHQTVLGVLRAQWQIGKLPLNYFGCFARAVANWQIATKLFWVFCVQVPKIVLNDSVLM